MSNFVKLYGTILYSTVWLEPLPTKVVWITMLALADADGVVAASIPGLAQIAGVTREECEKAIDTLSSPDPDSKTPDYEGRRIQKVDTGWLILNHRKYRDLRTETQVRTAERVRRFRETHKGNSVTVTDVTDVTRRNGMKQPVRAEEEEDADRETTRSTTSPNGVTGNGQHPKASPRKANRLIPTPAEQEVIRHYRSKHPRRGPPDDQQIRKIRRGLQFFTADQLKLAIDGNLEDEWSVAKKKHGVGWIFKDNDTISENIDRAQSANTPLIGENGELTEAGIAYFARTG